MNKVLQSEDPLLTADEMAEYLKMCRSKVFAIIQRGDIPSIRIGRNVRVKYSEFKKYLEEKSKKK